MPPGEQEPAASETLYAEVLRNGEDAGATRRFLEERALDEPAMIGLLHRAVPVAFLESVAATSPWSERPRVLGAIVLNTKSPRTLAQRLLPYLYWRDLADAAVSPRVEGGVRARAEGLLKDKVVELRLGDKITLARLAPPSVLRLLLRESDPKILDAALLNPRLREADLVPVVQAGGVFPLAGELRRAARPRLAAPHAVGHRPRAGHCADAPRPRSPGPHARDSAAGASCGRTGGGEASQGIKSWASDHGIVWREPAP
jgi:hypothetical protein